MSVARGASRMGLATLCSRILGLAREQVFANLFGATHAADAFNIAFRIPNLLRDLFAEGAMSAAFVPNFARALESSRAGAFRLAAGVLSALGAITVAITLIGVVLSKPIVLLYAGSFQSVPGKFELAVGMTRIMFPFFPFVAFAAVLMGALNAMGFFFLPAFAPVLFNVASILAGFFLCPVMEPWFGVPKIYGMALGVVAGGFLQFYVQWRQFRRQGFRPGEYRAALLAPLRVDGVRKVLALLVPGTVGLAATQLGILINSIYATSAGAGAVSWLNYAFRLMQFPIGIFGVSLAAAMLPSVSRKLAVADTRAAAQELQSTLRLSFCVNLAASAGLMAAGLPIVELLFRHGAFGVLDSVYTADAVFWYAAGLPGYSVVKILVPIYYALGTTRVPVLISFTMVGLNAALNHAMLHWFSMPFWSLALATSVTSTLNAVLLGVLLSRHIPAFGKRFWSGILGQTAIAGALFFVVRGAMALLEHGVSLGIVRLPAQLLWGVEVFGVMGVAIAFWLTAGKIFGVEENQKAWEFLKRKFIQRKRASC